MLWMGCIILEDNMRYATEFCVVWESVILLVVFFIYLNLSF